jgi:hypothetical protein
MGPQHIGTMARVNFTSTQHSEEHQIHNSIQESLSMQTRCNTCNGHFQLWYDNRTSTKNMEHYVCTVVFLQILHCAQLDQTLEQQCDN